MSYNKVILLGRLGADVEMEKNAQQKVARGSLATTESYKDRNGDWKEIVDWVQIRFYDKMAERAVGKLKKGMEVMVEGKIKTWKFERGGKTEYATAVKVERFIVPKGTSSTATHEPASSEDGEDFGQREDDSVF